MAGPAVLVIPLLGLLAAAGLAGRKRKRAPESDQPPLDVEAPAEAGGPVILQDPATGTRVAIPSVDAPAIADAIAAGAEGVLGDLLEQAGVAVSFPVPAPAPQPEPAPEPQPEPAPEPSWELPRLELPPELDLSTIQIPGVTMPAEPVPFEPEYEPWTAYEPVSEDTAAVQRELLDAEQTPRWKFISERVRQWQRARGLVADGMFGPRSALRMATEVGVLPLVRYWATGTLPETAVPAYREAIDAIADEAPEPRASQLRASALREQGQGFGV
jgi:hypothetical protein